MLRRHVLGSDCRTSQIGQTPTARRVYARQSPSPNDLRRKRGNSPWLEKSIEGRLRSPRVTLELRTRLANCTLEDAFRVDKRGNTRDAATRPNRILPSEQKTPSLLLRSRLKCPVFSSGLGPSRLPISFKSKVGGHAQNSSSNGTRLPTRAMKCLGAVQTSAR